MSEDLRLIASPSVDGWSVRELRQRIAYVREAAGRRTMAVLKNAPEAVHALSTDGQLGVNVFKGNGQLRTAVFLRDDANDLHFVVNIPVDAAMFQAVRADLSALLLPLEAADRFAGAPLLRHERLHVGNDPELVDIVERLRALSNAVSVAGAANDLAKRYDTITISIAAPNRAGTIRIGQRKVFSNAAEKRLLDAFGVVLEIARPEPNVWTIAGHRHSSSVQEANDPIATMRVLKDAGIVEGDLADRR